MEVWSNIDVVETRSVFVPSKRVNVNGFHQVDLAGALRTFCDGRKKIQFESKVTFCLHSGPGTNLNRFGMKIIGRFGQLETSKGTSSKC